MEGARSSTLAVAAAPEAGNDHILEEHIVAARVRAFEQAATNPGALALPAPSAARKQCLPSTAIR